MKDRHPLTRLTAAAMAACTLLLGACSVKFANPDDPLESYNRAMFGFNEKVDEVALRPVAHAYEAATPLPIRTGIGNFFGNVGDVWIGGNNLLQGKVVDGLSDWLRFVLNSTVGILGVFDVATEVGLPKHDEDVGQTLGRWGVGEGAYFIVPFFGPRTIRDAAVLPLDLYGDNVWGIKDIALRNSLTALRLINARANLLGIDKTLEEGTLDKYSYARDFYLQQRRYRVHDGNVPPEDFESNGAALPPGLATDVGALAAVSVLQLVKLDGRDGESRNAP